MKYYLRKETNPQRKSYDRWSAVAVHDETISQQQIEREVQANCSAKVSDVKLVMTDIIETIERHLKRGDRVRLDYWGLMKLEIESRSVERAEDFDTRKHVRALRLHFLPESRRGRQSMYSGVKLERVKI